MKLFQVILQLHLVIQEKEKGFPGGAVVKNPPANAEDAGLNPGSGRSPGGGHGNPFQYSCLGNPIDRGAVGYSPWGHKESDTTEVIKQQPV